MHFRKCSIFGQIKILRKKLANFLEQCNFCLYKIKDFLRNENIFEAYCKREEQSERDGHFDEQHDLRVPSKQPLFQSLLKEKIKFQIFPRKI